MKLSVIIPAFNEEETILNIPGLYEPSPTPISGLIISHTHQDHYGALFARRMLSPVDVLHAITERISRLNPTLNAFAVLNSRAYDAAGESASRFSCGTCLGRYALSSRHSFRPEQPFRSRSS